MALNATGARGFQSKPKINLNSRVARKSLRKSCGACFRRQLCQSGTERLEWNKEMRSKTTIEIYAYWDELRGHRDVPARGQIEPAHVRHILPDLFILEKTPRGEIRFRLAGTRICALFARELRGSRFDALWLGEQTTRIERIACDVLAQKAPVVLTAAAIAGAADPLASELVLLPLKSPEGRVDRIIGALVPLSRPHWLGATPVNFLELGAMRRLDMDAAGVLLQNRPATSRPSHPRPAADTGLSGAIRRVLHLRVFEGGRRD
jgi:hypothetical protein